MSADVMGSQRVAGDLRIGDLIVAVNGHPTPSGFPAEVLAVGWSLVNNVLDLTLWHDGSRERQQLHISELVEVQR